MPCRRLLGAYRKLQLPVKHTPDSGSSPSERTDDGAGDKGDNVLFDVHLSDLYVWIYINRGNRVNKSVMCSPNWWRLTSRILVVKFWK